MNQPTHPDFKILEERVNTLKAQYSGDMARLVEALANRDAEAAKTAADWKAEAAKRDAEAAKREADWKAESAKTAADWKAESAKRAADWQTNIERLEKEAIQRDKDNHKAITQLFITLIVSGFVISNFLILTVLPRLLR